VDITEISCECVDWIQLAYNKNVMSGFIKAIEVWAP